MGRHLCGPRCDTFGMKTNRWIEKTLIVPETNPKLLPPERLFYWLAMPGNPVFASPNPFIKMLIEAILAGKQAEFFYMGGSTPGLAWMITPSLVFQHDTN